MVLGDAIREGLVVTGRTTAGRRLLVGVGLALVASTWLPVTTGAAPVRERAELTGSGAWTVSNPMGSWRSRLYYSAQAMDLTYLPKGDRDGRHAFARGDADFVVTGRPLSAADEAELAERKVGTISAPINVASAAILWSGPYPTGVRVFTPDPVDPEEGTFEQYRGTLRLPMTTLARVFVDRGINNWYDAEFLAANASFLPAGSDWAPVINPTAPVVRSDPSASNYFMEEVVQKYAGDQFLLKLGEAELEGFATSESWPFLDTASRSGAANVANLVAGWQNPSASVITTGGVMTVAPASEVAAQREDFPDTPLFVPELQNAAGEWVAPTSEAITAAVAAGGETPMAAMTQPIPGAYPLVWVNRLYAPASGLDIDRTNAVATLIRYGVTTGQDDAVALGEGRLSEALVAEALAAADKIVAGNCTGADRRVVTATDGGPLWPTGLGLPVGSFTVCESTAAGATTTTTSAPTSTSAVARGTSSTLPSGSSGSSGGASVLASGGSRSTSGPYSSGSGDSSVEYLGSTSPDLSSPELSNVAGDAVTADGGGDTGIDVALASASLPMSMPDDGRGTLDRLTTMLLGGVVLVVANASIRRRRVAS